MTDVFAASGVFKFHTKNILNNRRDKHVSKVILYTYRPKMAEPVGPIQHVPSSANASPGVAGANGNTNLKAAVK